MAEKVVKDINEDFLSCCICMGNFKTPKMLPCIHSFCEGCLEKYAAKQDSDQIPCPTCRKVCKLPETGVKGLPTNFHLINLAERVALLGKLTSTTKKASACDSCKSPEIIAFCVDCNFAICLKCQGHHSLFPLLSTHTVIPLTQLNDPKFQQEWRPVKSPLCQWHSSEKLHFYCNTCSQLICRDCTIVLHSKPDHEYVEASSKFADIKDNLNKHLETGKDLLEEGLAVMQRGVKGLDQMNKEKVRLEAELTTYCKKSLAEIETKFDELKNTIVARYAERVIPIETQIEHVKHWIERMKNTQEITQNVVQDNNPWELLAMSADLTAAFEALRVDSKTFELDHCDLKNKVSFEPRVLPDIQVGEILCLPADAVATDGKENFFLCDFDKASRMLSIMKISVKDYKLECIFSYEWKDDYIPGARLVADVHVYPNSCLVVGIGKVLARFNVRSISFQTKKQVKIEGCIQGIVYDRYSGYFYFADQNGSIGRYDGDFNYSCKINLVTTSRSFYSYNYHLIYGHIKYGGVKCFNANYNKDENMPINNPDDMVITDTAIIRSIGDDNMVFYVLYKGSVRKTVGKGSDNKQDGWVLQEFSKSKNKLLGILKCLDGGKAEPPKAVLARETTDGTELYLCDDCGKITRYRRGVYRESPLKYVKL